MHGFETISLIADNTVNSTESESWLHGRVVIHWSAKPGTSVQIRLQPQTPLWWNGRHEGLKIPWPIEAVWVQIPLGALINKAWKDKSNICQSL